jgi:rubredoxin
MPDNMKKPILILVVLVCLASAGAVTLVTRSKKDGIPKSFAKEMTWVKCRNPACNTEYQITKKEYFVYVERNQDWQAAGAPALICEKCGEPSIYRAVKCKSCGLVFEMGSVPLDFQDRCPKCKFSMLEHDKKQNARDE